MIRLPNTREIVLFGLQALVYRAREEGGRIRLEFHVYNCGYCFSVVRIFNVIEQRSAYFPAKLRKLRRADMLGELEDMLRKHPLGLSSIN